MRRRPIFLSAVLMVTAAGAGGAWWLLAAQADTTPAWRAQPVVLGSVEDMVSAVGTLQPREYVDVGTQVSGQVKKIHVGFGANVEQGQLLAQLDPTVYEAKVGADMAQLSNLRAQIADRTAQLALADKQLERQRRLLAERATSQDAFDVAESGHKSLAAQIQALEAQTKQTESTLKADTANLSYTQIYAPISGTVVDILAKTGQTLNANQQAPIVLRIADLDTMTVWTQVSEADVNKLRIGMPAYFTTLGQIDRRREGVLHQVLPTPTVVNNVVLYNALFDVNNPDRDLLPQMTAQVFFVIAQARSVPVVPMAALRPVARTGNRYIARVVENGQPVDRPVEIGATNRVIAEIRSGLKVGDQIVVDGAGTRRPAR